MIERTEDIEACRSIRREVFIVEQGVSEAEEIDDLDGSAIHLLARGEGGQPLGTARLLLLGDTGKIGRVAVRKPARGTGLGARLIEASIEELRGIPGITRVKLSAQTHAITFYERFGFAAHGPVYDDAGIPHRDMTLALG
ncbi:ElaA protein [Paracoccus halophilus]|uniref:Drug:proton antiporter n=1 Tax=Paracoccus halophilus TaxID=376733 RepID=A0A099F2R7_9RHOB|nr:GNAT family N-acetyltransferase [Paracoccus halophilus]KGJ04754.1 drug:proton antiporter [Paracoccus halophilus]SFA51031.1 ElaA protein [Paracoccus halophilus]